MKQLPGQPITVAEYWHMIRQAIVSAKGKGNQHIVQTSGGK